MAKAKKQQEKFGSWIRKVWYDEEHSIADHDSHCRKDRKKDAKKLRRIREKDTFGKE